MDSFLLFPLLAGWGIALLAGPLGALVVWRRMAYFGDTLAHASLLGVALGIWWQVDLTLTVMLGCLLLAALLWLLQGHSDVGQDTLLGIMAHSALSLGLVAVAMMGSVRVDLMAYLFGDLLAVSITDLAWIWCGVALIGLLLWRFWDPLLAITINEELAQVEGINTRLMRALLLGMVAVVIAVAMKIVGALIISSLLLIPAATARRFSLSPEQMAFGASALGMLAVTLGLMLSWYQDTPAGPSVVVCAAGLFGGVQLLIRRR